MSLTPDTDQLRQALDALEADESLLDDAQFAARIAALDELEFALLAALSDDRDRQQDAQVAQLAGRAEALRLGLTAANQRLFERLRAALTAPHATPAERMRILQPFVSRPALPAAGAERPYDDLDRLLDGILQLEAPEEQADLLDPELIGYQPTPARVIFELIERAAISDADLFVDLGSGLGQVAILVAMLTGAHAIGVEIDPALCDAARRSAAALGVSNVTFLAADARVADLEAGTIFYLYTPFTGTILQTVLDRLRAIAARRPIRICAYGPYLAPLAEQPWLRVATPAGSGSVTIFASRDPHG